MINADIEKFPKGILVGPCIKEELYATEAEKRFPELQTIKAKWRDAEYLAYFAQCPDNSLEDLELGAIAKGLEKKKIHLQSAKVGTSKARENRFINLFYLKNND